MNIKEQFATLRRLYNKLRDRFAFIRKLSNSKFACLLRRKFFIKSTAPQAVQIKIKPRFTVLLAAGRDDTLKQSLKSLKRQSYENFGVIVADLTGKGALTVKDQKVKYCIADGKNLSQALNGLMKSADGDYVIVLSEGDRLSKDALSEVVKAVNTETAVAYYSDESKIGGVGGGNVFYPCFSPDLLYSKVFAPHFFAVKREVLVESGEFGGENHDALIYDLILRLSEKTRSIGHIPEILCNSEKSDDNKAENLKILNAHLRRKYKNAFAVCDGGIFDTRFKIDGTVKISIIIPTKDHSDLLDACVKSILEKTEYKNYEILLLDNNSEEKKTFEWFKEIQQKDERIKVVQAAFPFNWSKLNNFGIEKATGGVFVFLNNDTVVISPDWLERLAENALREEIGVVGAQLLYEDGTLQHAGVVVGMGGWADHVYKGENPDIIETPFVAPAFSRNVMAVTGACMAISRKTIDAIGNFNDTFEICGSDVEICIRAHKMGLYNLYDARVKLYHLESKSRSSFVPEIDFVMSAKYYSPYREQGDPFYNANLDLNSSTPKERG